MGSTSQEILRSLCSNTVWKYAVFWKLNHRSRMVLTLDDAYYDNDGQNNSPEVKGCSVIPHGGHDPLGLAMAKMSYHVYSLGEGIVGQVAVSGRHQWVFPEYYDNSHSAFEFHNVWESQISAGIKVLVCSITLMSRTIERAFGVFGVLHLEYCKLDLPSSKSQIFS